MKDGFKVWDTDTHVRPTLELIEPYFDPGLRARLPELEKYKRVVAPSPGERESRTPGNHDYTFPGRIPNQRILGQAGPAAEGVRAGGKHMGRKFPSVGAEDSAVDARIQDMDEEGVDVQLLVPGFPHPVLLNDPELDVGFMRAFNRFLNDFCGKYPGRLKALLPTVSSDVAASVEEIRRWSDSPWMVGVWPYESNEHPLDHPDNEPIWEAVDDAGLVVVHHSRAYTPPYFPGYRDLWDNIFLGRSCSHPWGAMRAVGAFIGAGLMDRYTNLRFGILECGCGWLPFWARRLDDQAEYVGGTPHLEHSISEHMSSGRFYSSLEMHEGEDMIQMVCDFLGPDVLMYASDYPHPECQFPDSVSNFLSWKNLSDDLRQKLLWDNPVRFYGEP
jgi:predicted TIM-barrel fold metal-dependent hydrolase